MPALKGAKKRGVKVKISAPITAANEKVAKELAKVAEVKNMPDTKARFAVIDGKEVMLMLLDDEKIHPNYDTGVWLNTEFLARSLEQMLDAASRKGKSK